MAQTAFRRRSPVAAPLLMTLTLALGLGLVLPAATRSGAVTDEPTPAPTPTPGPNAGREAVLDAAFDALPPAPVVVTLTRLAFPAGSRAAGDGPAGPRFVIVETQAIVVVAAAGDRPRLTRAPGSGSGPAPAPAPDPARPEAGGEIRLSVGDGLVLELAPVELRNEGARPSSVLIAAVTPLTAEANGLLPVPVQGRPVEPDPDSATPAVAGAAADALPGGPFLTAEEVLVAPLAGGIVAVLPSGPGEVRLDLLRIAAGWHTPLPVQPGPWLLLVESGTLGLASQAGTVFYRGAAAPNPASVPGRAKTVAPGAEVILTAGGMSFVHPDAVVELRNRGRTTLVLLVLTVRPARAEHV